MTGHFRSNNRSDARRILSATFICTAIIYPTFGPMANAQDQAALEEIIVTAQKREENLQSVPLAVSAYSSEVLDRQNISNMTDLKFRVPSLLYDEFSAGQPRYYIRGVGNNLQSGALDDNVGVFIDGVYLGRPEMTNNDFLDIERIEVLRGPQGTLFGRNVVGGAISYLTRRPTEELRMRGSVTFGNYNQIDASGYVSGPITDRVFAKVAATTRNHDGYNFNTTTQNDVEDQQFAAGRAAVRFLPSDTLDVQLSADFSRRRGTGTWSMPLRPSPSFFGPNNHLDDVRVGEHDDDDGVADIDNEGVNLNIDWETELGTVTSITAYRHNEMEVRFNVNGLRAAQISDPPAERATTAQSVFYQLYDSDTDQFSQELRLASSASDRLTWVAGLYYFYSDAFFNSTDKFRFLFADIEGFRGLDQTTVTKAFAVFGTVKYDVTDRFSVQAGVRYSNDKKATKHATVGAPAFGPWTIDGVPAVGWTTDVTGTWDATTPALTINYQATPNHFLYASVSRGFKSGGFANKGDDKVAAETPVNPEFAWNYELGAKTEWLDRKVRLNMAAFFINYTDMQLRTLVPLNPFQNIEITASAGEADVKGVEVELDWVVNEALSIQTSYSYLDTEISDTIIDGVDRSGNELAKAPSHKVFVGATYTVPLNGSLDLSVRADYSASDEFWSFITNDPVERVPSRDNYNAGIALRSKAGNWSLELWGKNLTDETHPSTITSVNGTGFAVPFDPPRTYGITFQASFAGGAL